MTITVAVAGKELTFADALAIRLDAEEDITVVAVTQAARGPVPGPPADVVLLDAGLALDGPGGPGAANPGQDGRVVMLGGTWEPVRIAEAMAAGVSAWVGQDDSVEYLLNVLRSVARGETWRPAEEGGAVSSPSWPRRGERDSDRPPVTLTPRERQVLDCLADGAGRREVAARLHVSVNTVRTHMQNLMTKLGVHSSVEAVAVARGQPRLCR